MPWQDCTHHVMLNDQFPYFHSHTLVSVLQGFPLATTHVQVSTNLIWATWIMFCSLSCSLALRPYETKKGDYTTSIPKVRLFLIYNFSTRYSHWRSFCFGHRGLSLLCQIVTIATVVLKCRHTLFRHDRTSSFVSNLLQHRFLVTSIPIQIFTIKCQHFDYSAVVFFWAHLHYNIENTA